MAPATDININSENLSATNVVNIKLNSFKFKKDLKYSKKFILILNFYF